MRDSRIDVMRGIAMLMMISDHCAYSVFSKITLAHTQFCDASEIFFLISGYSCMAAFGEQFDTGHFQDGLSGIMRSLTRIYFGQVFMVISCLMIVKAWDFISSTDFLAVSQSLRNNGNLGVLSSKLYEYGWNDAPSILIMTDAPYYFDTLRTYLVLIALFPAMWFGLRRAPWAALTISVLVWVLAHGPHGLAFYSGNHGQVWFFNPFGWQLIFMAGVCLRIIMETRTTLPKYLGITLLSVLVIAFGLLYQVIVPAAPHSLMFKTNLSPIRTLNAFAIVYIALSRDWQTWFIEAPIVNAVRIVGRNSLAVYVTGTLISLIVDMADVGLGEGALAQTLVVSVGLLAATEIAQLAERRRSKRRSWRRAVHRPVVDSDRQHLGDARDHRRDGHR